MITVPDRYGRTDGRHVISQPRSALASHGMKWKTLHSKVHLPILVDPQYETFTTISNILLYFITLLYNYSLFHELVSSPTSNNSVWRTLSLLLIEAYSVSRVITAHNAAPLNHDWPLTVCWSHTVAYSRVRQAWRKRSYVAGATLELDTAVHNRINKWKPVNFLLNTNKV